MSDCGPAAPMKALEAYGLLAPEYDSTPNPLLSLEARTLAPLVHSACGRDVVDLGCGTGRWLVEFAGIGARSVTGIDACPEMLEQAAKKLIGNTRLVLADCASTPLETASCDWILASFLLSYVGDLRRFAAEASRIARPGARLVLSDVHPDTSSYGWRRTFSHAQKTIEIETVTYRISELKAVMETAGFEETLFCELPFGEEEKGIFLAAGRADLFARVEGRPVMFVAIYRMSRS
jgi:ubiquinone/menaquinone biosynthesis C-methylase UbiE